MRDLNTYGVPVMIMLAVALLEWFDLDHKLMAMAYDPAVQVFPLRHHWLTEGVIHTLGRQLIAVLGITVLFALAGSLLLPSLKPVRWEWGFVVLSIVVSTLCISTLKATTGVHCAYDLALYGGDQPANQLANLWSGGGACWPGGHVSGPLSLIAIYFAFFQKQRWLAIGGLGLALALGLIFGIGQALRGAHFPSHTLWSLLIVWLVNVILARLLLPSPVKRSLELGATS